MPLRSLKSIRGTGPFCSEHVDYNYFVRPVRCHPMTRGPAREGPSFSYGCRNGKRRTQTFSFEQSVEEEEPSRVLLSTLLIRVLRLRRLFDWKFGGGWAFPLESVDLFRPSGLFLLSASTCSDPSLEPEDGEAVSQSAHYSRIFFLRSVHEKRPRRSSDKRTLPILEFPRTLRSVPLQFCPNSLRSFLRLVTAGVITRYPGLAHHGV
jgi:hypothetical protein